MKCLRCKQKQLKCSSILHNRLTCFDGLLKCLHPIYVHVLMIDSLLQVNIGCTCIVCGCIVCGEDYENSKPGETWVMCAACKMWAHEECTPKEGDACLCDGCGARKT